MSDLRVPGDKSIAHRFLILASLADDDSDLSGIPASLDVASTLRCLRDLGAKIEDVGAGRVKVRGGTRWMTPPGPLSCGNSGTTARLLAGLLAGLGLRAELRGDESLSGRPMDRVVYPLQAMGAQIDYLGSPDRLPLLLARRVSGGLRKLRYRPRVSSAQVRGALLLAALAGRSDIEIIDRGCPRDHTERLLRWMGAPVVTEPAGTGERIRFEVATWSGHLRGLSAVVPGDLSSAAFLVVAALVAGVPLEIHGVGLNPTRDGFLRVLEEMGADVKATETGRAAGEPVGVLRVRPSRLVPFTVGGGLIPRLIDEIPALAILASRVEGVSSFRDAAELRVKESDRISSLVENLTRLGVPCEEFPDGLLVHGSPGPVSGTIRTGGDHRIAMAFAALGAAEASSVDVDDPSCVEVSFPGYWDALRRVTHRAGTQ